MLVAIAVGASALIGLSASVPSRADDVLTAYVAPAQLTPAIEAARQQPVATAPTTTVDLRPSYGSPTATQLSNELLQAYVDRQQQLKNVNVDANSSGTLNQQVLLGYIERTSGSNSQALDAINSFADEPALNADVLSTYAQKKFVPTVKKLQTSGAEKLCLTQAIYHEARGESDQGQWAVANVVINRAMSHKFPPTLCGVVFQNADQGFHRCQFTFACDGKSDMGTETGAWNKASQMASVAYKEFENGQRPGVVPSSALYYHTVSVDPNWGPNIRRVAVIGQHEFYAVN
jgi:spore germination cell wall hydrolase CwlJ-like protein